MIYILSLLIFVIISLYLFFWNLDLKYSIKREHRAVNYYRKLVFKQAKKSERFFVDGYNAGLRDSKKERKHNG